MNDETTKLRAALLALVRALDAAPARSWTKAENVAQQEAKALLYDPAQQPAGPTATTPPTLFDDP